MELTQVSAPVLNTMIFAALIGILGPIIAAWVSAVKFKTKVSPIFLGISGYIISELFIRSGLLQALSGTAFFKGIREIELLYQLFLAVTIVVFEELVRWLIMRFAFNKRANDEYACSFGVSWGAVECLITLGLVYFSYYMTAKTINAGNYGILSEVELADLTEASKYIATLSPLSIVLDIIKGVAGMVMQVFYTFVITRGIVNKTTPFCLGLAAIVHLLYIYVPTLLILLPAGLIISTLFCSLCATLLLYYMKEAMRRAKYYKDQKNQTL